MQAWTWALPDPIRCRPHLFPRRVLGRVPATSQMERPHTAIRTHTSPLRDPTTPWRDNSVSEWSRRSPKGVVSTSSLAAIESFTTSHISGQRPTTTRGETPMDRLRLSEWWPSLSHCRPHQSTSSGSSQTCSSPDLVSTSESLTVNPGLLPSAHSLQEP